MAGSTLIYVGAEADGLYRKEAGDTRWEKLAKGMPPSPQVREIVVHPNDPRTIFVGTQRGIYRSRDGGDSFERMNMTEGRIVWSIKFDPHDANIMFLGTEGSEVFKSTDGGENWQYLSTVANPEAVQMAFATRILGIGIESSDTNQMYAALEVGGAAHSSDGGKTWTIVNSVFEGDVDLLDLHGVTVGANEQVFISNRTGVWRTRDRGATWDDLQFENFSNIRYSRGVEVAPNDPSTLYACIGLNFGSEEGGILRSTDAGETWGRFDQGVAPSSTTFGIAVNERDPQTVYFCTRKGQVFGTHDGGATWQGHDLPGMAANVKAIACTSV